MMIIINLAKKGSGYWYGQASAAVKGRAQDEENRQGNHTFESSRTTST
jgi:hypothetical protein